MDHTYENYLNEGNILLNRADEELNKPFKDVMTLSICHGTKLAIDNLLKAYLVKHQVADVESGNLLSRFEQCIRFTPDFKIIDLHSLDCIHDDTCSMSEYCMTVNKVTECVEMAKELRNLMYR